jgi:Glyoxalase/Bleomycin resistance protein/Dioxygenase superfamily
MGIIVADLERSAAQFSAALGCSWGPPREVAATMWTPEGDIDVMLTYTYSSGPQPRLELICGSSGSPWDPATHSGADHVCYWSDDVAADSNALVAEGMPLAVTHAGEGPKGFVYHHGADGFRIELMARSGMAGVDNWMLEHWEPPPAD